MSEAPTIDRYESALQRITPGGSEFYMEPERCADFVQERSQNQHKHILRLTKERDAAVARADKAEREAQINWLRAKLFSEAEENASAIECVRRLDKLGVRGGHAIAVHPEPFPEVEKQAPDSKA